MEKYTAQKRTSEWWRWLLMPFAAIFGASLGGFLLTFLQWSTAKMEGFSEGGLYLNYILPIMSSIVFGWLYVLITLEVAPRGKVNSAIVMTAIFGVFNVVNVISIWAWHLGDTAEAVQSTVASIVATVAAVISVVELKDEYT